jgi:hypothetical protein
MTRRRSQRFQFVFVARFSVQPILEQEERKDREDFARGLPEGLCHLSDDNTAWVLSLGAADLLSSIK